MVCSEILLSSGLSNRLLLFLGLGCAFVGSLRFLSLLLSTGRGSLVVLISFHRCNACFSGGLHQGLDGLVLGSSLGCLHIFSLRHLVLWESHFLLQILSLRADKEG